MIIRKHANFQTELFDKSSKYQHQIGCTSFAAPIFGKTKKCSSILEHIKEAVVCSIKLIFTTHLAPEEQCNGL